MSIYDAVSVHVHSLGERADPELGNLSVGGQGGPGGPLHPAPVDAFIAHGSEAQRWLLGRNGGRAALAIAGLAAIFTLLSPTASMATWVQLAIVAGAGGAGLLLVRRPALAPLWVMDVAQVAAMAGLVGVAYVGGPMVTAIPFIYLANGATIFVLRRWPVVLVHTVAIGASAAAVLWLTHPYAPVTRWIGVMAAVMLYGLFIRWLVSRAASLAVAERQLLVQAAEASAELAEVSQAKTAFLARMSHELRTPLNVVLGFADVLALQSVGPLNKRQEEYVADIATSSRHLVALVDDVLDIARVETGRLRLELSRVDLWHVVNEAVRMVRERAITGGVELRVDVNPAIEPLEADERKLLQAVVNLLSNAVKFTPPGGRVTVSARAVGSAIRIAVQDTGVGIAPQDIDRIFEVYAQTAPSAEGVGLGLPLTRRFIELHGGTLTATSDLGRGSTFTIELPMQVAPGGESDAAAETASENDYSAITEPGSLANRMLLAKVGGWTSFVAAGLISIFAVVTPISMTTRLIMLAVAAVAVSNAVLIRNAGSLVSTNAFELFHIFGVVAITVFIYHVRNLADIIPLAYASITITSFALSQRRRALSHFLLVVAAYGLVLLLRPEKYGAERFISLFTLLSVMGVYVAWYVEQVRRLVVSEQAAHRHAEEARAQLAAMSKHKSDFLANMSHELRTPLNAIVGFSDLLASGVAGPLNDKQCEYIDDVRVAAAHLLALINDILDLARLEAGQVQLSVEPIAVPALLERVSAVVAADAAQQDVEVVASVDPGVDLISADHTRLEQVLVKLTLNAVKFTPAKGSVQLTAANRDGELLLSVHDTGIGISADDRDSIFEAFHQVHRDGIDQLPEGPGLGLALARGLIQLHHGRIWVESEPGRGSTFTIALPRSLSAELPALGAAS
jgi:signal transduction histidine kinase